MQRLLNAARWDEGKVRDALGRYVARHLGDADAVLIGCEGPIWTGTDPQ